MLYMLSQRTFKLCFFETTKDKAAELETFTSKAEGQAGAGVKARRREKKEAADKARKEKEQQENNRKKTDQTPKVM